MTPSKRLAIGLLLVGLLLTACATPSEATTEEPAAPAPEESAADLAAVKDYALDQANQMKAATSRLATTAQEYFDLIEANGFDYAASWAANPGELSALIAQAKEQWLESSLYYELDEGIVAGVPSLAYFDTWIDAGPNGEEDPDEAIDWQLELPDRRVLDKPGNFFHHLTEPTIWATNPDFTGLAVDLDGDGAIEFAEGLPEANIFLAATQGLDEATAEMQTAIAGWEPTLSDAFTALVVMVPTMNEYFEQWKLSAYVTGNATEKSSFVAVSRLFDINGILSGLSVTYENIAVLVEEHDADLHAQIESGLADLVAYVGDLYAQESEGRIFSAEEADLFGTEAQDQATAVSGQVAQAAALLNIEIQE